MKKLSREPGATQEAAVTSLRDRLIGLGERSFRKNYFPELQERLDELERFRVLLDHSSDMILLVHLPSRHIIDVNSSASHQLGYAQQELLGRDIEEIIDMERLIWPEAEPERPRGGRLRTRLRRQDGTEIAAELAFSMDCFAGSDYVIAVARDITESLRAQERLQQSEARFRAIFRSAAAGMAIINARGEFLQVNPALCRFLDLPEESLLQKTVEQVTHAEDRANTRRFYRELIPGQEQHYEKRYLRPDGSVVWGHVAVAWLYGPDLQSMQIIALVQDITGRKRAEKVLRESDRIKSEFIAVAAHELRNPLTAIMGFSQLLLSRSELTEQERTELLTHIHEKSINLSLLMDDLLDIARIEAGQKMCLKRTTCPVSEIIGSVAPMIQNNLEKRRFELDFQQQEELLLVDKLKIVQVLENLLSNAIKYSRKDARIVVSGRVCDNRYQFSIRDEGIGMNPEQVERVFDKFYRADAASSEVSGLGLGMNIVKNIVEAHDGEIRVESAPGRGTTVRFTLPLFQNTA